MAFTRASQMSFARFNSDNSAEFLRAYESNWDKQIQEAILYKPHQTFAPSSFRCDRKSWFRLRGTEPDKLSSPDRTLDFSATLGTACHVAIQKSLVNMLGNDWISVREYLTENPIRFEHTLEEVDYETRISIKYPPINLSCDGIIRWKDKIYLLEIKTCEHSSFRDLVNYRDEHEDQIICYSSLLNIPNVLVLYQDRAYGDIKVYERFVNDNEMRNILSRMDHVMKCVEANIAPDRLPNGDKWCDYCPYSKKCKQWG